nr:ribonuclease H-like domain-containing protein [Tanacetum cinerariifolium]
MVTIDEEGVNWTGHAKVDTENYALMAFNFRNSGSDTKVTSCSKVCEESYAKLKKLYDEQREQLGVSSKDANQKFLRSLPFSWSQVSLIMRTKPGVDTLSFNDLYNNLRVFEYDVKGSTASSSSTHNVAFVSFDRTNSTNEVSTAYGVSTSSGHNSYDLLLRHLGNCSMSF